MRRVWERVKECNTIGRNMSLPPGSRVVTLTKEEVAQMQKDDSKVFMTSTHDFVERNLTPEEVKPLMLAARNAAVLLRDQSTSVSSNRDIAAAVCSANADLAKFSKTHIRFFEVATRMETTQQEIDDMYELIDLRARQEKGEITRENAMLRVIAIEADRQRRAGSLPEHSAE